MNSIHTSNMSEWCSYTEEKKFHAKFRVFHFFAGKKVGKCDNFLKKKNREHFRKISKKKLWQNSQNTQQLYSPLRFFYNFSTNNKFSRSFFMCVCLCAISKRTHCSLSIALEHRAFYGRAINFTPDSSHQHSTTNTIVWLINF